jgi:hypothetical protein
MPERCGLPDVARCFPAKIVVLEFAEVTGIYSALGKMGIWAKCGKSHGKIFLFGGSPRI